MSPLQWLLVIACGGTLLGVGLTVFKEGRMTRREGLEIAVPFVISSVTTWDGEIGIAMIPLIYGYTKMGQYFINRTQRMQKAKHIH